MNGGASGPAVVPNTGKIDNQAPNSFKTLFEACAASASDVVDGVVPVTCTPAAGATFALGPTTVSCTATDAHGNSASGSFPVTVTDHSAPALTVPTDLTATAATPGMEETGTRVFRLYYTPAADVAAMIKPALSPEGQVVATAAAGKGIDTSGGSSGSGGGGGGGGGVEMAGAAFGGGWCLTIGLGIR